MLTLELRGLDELLTALSSQGYRLLGPTIRDKAIVIDQISSVKDLPAGWTDSQEPGSYTLERRRDSAVFGYVVGPFSWKSFLRPPRVRVFTLKRNGKGFAKEETKGSKEPKPLAFIGVRSCEIQALRLYDGVFLNAPYADPNYRRVRSAAFILAVDCTRPGGCCFCTSMGGGTKAEGGYDIALTEVCEDGKHVFIARGGSSRGEAILASISSRQSTPEEEESVESQAREAASFIEKHVDAGKVAEALPGLFDSPAWEAIAKRCLACANCTMVCPTCFCSTIEETTDLTGASAERWCRWDSCFTMDYSKVAGGNIRPSTKARYRQWVMHKFTYWVDQFGSAGCVGCGRCITWCPAGIDVTSYLESLCSGQGNGTR